MTTLRNYQQELKSGAYAGWAAGHSNVMAVSPARSGKTVLFADIIRENQGGSVAIAHRARLVEQMSFALAKAGVRHRVIGPATLQRACSARHMRFLKCNFVDPNAWCAVASVNTLCKMKHEPWFDHVTLWVTDECHHLLLESMWGVACALFKRARGFAVTATPCRADGKGLGRHANGVIDYMVVGQSPRDLIKQGYIVDYRLVLAESDINIKEVHVGPSGEFVAKELSAAVHASKKFVGDVVREYQTRTPGWPGVCFAVDVASARDIAQAFNAAGIRAEVVTADTDDTVRLGIMSAYEAGQVKMLVNVDLFGEGVDLPDVRVVIMARHTNSYGLFIQQFWRGGTLAISKELQDQWTTFTDSQRLAYIAASSKPRFVVIDHVGNVMRHARTRGLPCMPQKWTLDANPGGRSAKAADDVVPLRICTNPDANDTGLPCAQPYERVLDTCPHCGHQPVPALRSGPEHVDGNMLELDDAALARFRGEVVAATTEPTWNHTWSSVINKSNFYKWQERMEAQAPLQKAMLLFCGYQMNHMGRSQAEMFKRFYFAFEIDTLSAQTLAPSDASKLRIRILCWLEKQGVVCG